MKPLRGLNHIKQRQEINPGQVTGHTHKPIYLNIRVFVFHIHITLTMPELWAVITASKLQLQLSFILSASS